MIASPSLYRMRMAGYMDTKKPNMSSTYRNTEAHGKVRHGTCQTSEQRMATSIAWRVISWCALVLGLWFAMCFSSFGVMAAGSGVDYKVSITGVRDGELRSALEEISDSVLLRKKRSPGSLAMLRRRVKHDIPLFLKLLKAEGFYGARVSSDIDEKDTPVCVTFHVALGSAYLLESVEIHTIGQDTKPGVKLPEPKELGLGLRKPAKALAILDGQEALIRLLRKQGFPFPQITERKVMVDHRDHTVVVIFDLDPGPLARFGPTKITGLKSVDEVFVRNMVPWQEEDRFNAGMLNQVEKRLIDTGLFISVRASTSETLEADGLLPVTIEVNERKHRTISAGVSYGTDEKLGATISWERRNLFHRGERLRLETVYSNIALGVKAAFRKPEFLRSDQLLRLDVRAGEDRPDAFTSRGVESSLIVDRTLAEGIIVGGGLAFKASRVEQIGKKDEYGLIALPVHFGWDTSDNLLDPSRGGRFKLEFAPFWDTFGSNLSFIKGKGSYGRYVRLCTKPCLVLAGKAVVGSMTGAARDSIPADERFYSGGGGSIRGYPYQSVGPRDGAEPLGGRSLLEVSCELRLKLGADFGLVTFIDGGSAFASSGPDFGDDVLWGTGLGFRYFTGIGPVRLDVGIPLDRREGIDDAFQVYVSLGQAF